VPEAAFKMICSVFLALVLAFCRGLSQKRGNFALRFLAKAIVNDAN